MSSYENSIRARMEANGLNEATIRSFLYAVGQLAGGASGLISERTIEPLADLPRLADVPPGDAPLDRLVVVKLNGGLGTSMGLDRAKSLLTVREGLNFLDLTAQQILAARGSGTVPAFYLMNSFSTRQDSLSHLEAYPRLVDGQAGLDFLQSRVPKIDPETFEPIAWVDNPALEWCPPGHGDLYPSLSGSGLLDDWLERGIEYLFVSNSDNLGATIDTGLLAYFAESGLDFLMEVAERTASDRKGGHLARRASDGRLLLRELAQTPPADSDSFQDTAKHRFFNTNNLWVRLPALRQVLDDNGGAIRLPLIRNNKTVDPKDPKSPPVVQLETAMGAAIESFSSSGAIVVPRSRFAPVKTTADLLALRSDAYIVSQDYRVELAATRAGQPPLIDLDVRYKMVDEFDAAFEQGVPSLLECASLKVSGPLRFSAGVRCFGDVSFVNESAETRLVPPGEYRNQVVVL